MTGTLKSLVTPQNLVKAGFDDLMISRAGLFAKHGFLAKHPKCMSAVGPILDGVLARSGDTLKKGGTQLNTYLVVHLDMCRLVLDGKDLDMVLSDSKNIWKIASTCGTARCTDKPRQGHVLAHCEF